MPKTKLETASVFSKFLGHRAREIAAEGHARIIKPEDFPPGAPVHEDGSSEYDPKKPLVLFAIQITDQIGQLAWKQACAEYDRMISDA